MNVPKSIQRETTNALTPMEILERAVAQGANVETLDKLMTLQERWEKNLARKAFDNAMSAAKAEIPVIEKTRTVDFVGRTGIRTNYRHEDMAGIARTVDPLLTKHGLSYRYRTETKEGIVTVTCIVSHRDGHSEENSLSAGRDETGNKNNIQAVGSTITYLQRYTLKAALGLAASDDDDTKHISVGALLNDAQATEITSLALEVRADMDKFLRYLGVESISDIPALRFKEAKEALEAKRATK